MILIIDFGSQYNQLIARRVRENRVFCQVEPPAIKLDAIEKLNPDGIILSGGPSSIYEKYSPRIDRPFLISGFPSLGSVTVFIIWWMPWAERSKGPQNVNTALPN